MIWSRTTLADFDGSRRNNFTTLRILFAWLVLYGHSYAIQKVPGLKDPLIGLFQGSTWIGELAVNGFFVISGFLVTASYVRRGLRNYAISRMLRIFPGLAFCVFASVFILGPLVTTHSLEQYFDSAMTYQYLQGATAYKVQWLLPGVFESTPRNAVNGSLWTLPVELRCYVLLALIGLLGLFKYRLLANSVVLAIFIFGIYAFSDIPLLGENIRWSGPALYFLLGVLFYLNRDRVFLNKYLALAALLVSLTAFGRPWFDYAFPLPFVYLIFYAAYKTAYLDVDGKVGDISFGIYIYAWPIQQLVALYLPASTPYLNTLLASLLVIPLAFCSWHYLEKPALALKQKVF